MSIDQAFTHFPTLTTHRLLLRQLQTSDAEAEFATCSDEETMQYIPALPHKTLADTIQHLKRMRERYEQRQDLIWAITLKGSERVIGTCGFYRIQAEHYNAEIGYRLHRDFWRQGIVSEAVLAVVDYGFRELGFERIEAITFRENDKSQALLLKLGFKHEGILRKRFYFRDRFWDDYYFSMLKEEWETQKQHFSS